MSVRDESPLAPRVFTFADAFTAKGEQRRRILEAIVKQNEQRGAQLQAMTRATYRTAMLGSSPKNMCRRCGS